MSFAAEVFAVAIGILLAAGLAMLVNRLMNRKVFSIGL
jgi:hypothetical protein